MSKLKFSKLWFKFVFSMFLILISPFALSKTILFIGKTGVGKSSTINNFHHYLKGLDVRRPRSYLIPFTIGRTVFFGEGLSEVAQRDSSVSQTSSITKYPIFDGKKNYTFVDSAGFFDTGGAGEIFDEKRLKSLKSFLSENDVHAVVLVNSASDMRNTNQFEAVIEFLNGFFDSSVIGNISVFETFSNGDTANTEALLRAINPALSRNLFGLDNGCLAPLERLLSAIKKTDVKKREEKIKNIGDVWDRNAGEIKRFLSLVDKLNPIQTVGKKLGSLDENLVLVERNLNKLKKVSNVIFLRSVSLKQAERDSEATKDYTYTYPVAHERSAKKGKRLIGRRRTRHWIEYSAATGVKQEIKSKHDKANADIEILQNDIKELNATKYVFKTDLNSSMDSLIKVGRKFSAESISKTDYVLHLLKGKKKDTSDPMKLKDYNRLIRLYHTRIKLLRDLQTN